MEAPNKKVYNDFNSIVILAIREAASISVHELIDFINANNRRRIRINQIDTSTINNKLFNYYLQNFDFQGLQVNNQDSLFEKIELVVKIFEHDSKYIEKLKRLIKHTVNPILNEHVQVDKRLVPAIYEDLTYLSLDIDNLLDKIELKLFDPIEIKKVENENPTIQLEAFDVLLYNKIISNPKLIHTVTWREFEYLLKEILAAFEYEVELQEGTKDGGIDIIAIKKNDIFGEHKYLIQAKKWKNKKVDINPVRNLAFLKDHHKVSKVCLVTTSTFTKGAWDIAKLYPWQLELVDFNKLYDWINFAKMRAK